MTQIGASAHTQEASESNQIEKQLTQTNCQTQNIRHSDWVVFPIQDKAVSNSSTWLGHSAPEG